MVGLFIEDVDGPFGAEVIGLDPTVELDADTCRKLRRGFDERGLLLFRNLQADHPFQVRLSEMLIGNDTGIPRGLDRSPDDTFYISNRREGAAAPFGRLPFHSDAMWSDDPPLVLSLAAVDVEAPATPTMFASAVHAWSNLPPDLRARVEPLSAVHIAGLVRRGDHQDDVLIPTFEQPPSTVTPIRFSHPRTGRTLLQVCEQMTLEVSGLSPSDSESLLLELFAHLYDPATRWEHEWRNGDLVVWDNLAVHHARVNVPEEGPARTLRKYFSPIPALREDQRPAYSKSE
jgi:alpha-ketoglutarate-dependent taurine dioxygenase